MTVDSSAAEIERLRARVAELELELEKSRETPPLLSFDDRELFDNLPALIAILAPDGTVQFANRPLLEYTGKSLEEVSRWASGGAVPDEDLPGLIETFQLAISTGKPLYNELRARRFDGKFRWHSSSGVPVRDSAGRIRHWFLLLTDIDELKTAEAALRAREAELQLIIDTIPGLICLFTPEGLLEGGNQQFLQYLGQSSESMRNWATNGTIHPDDLPCTLAAFSHSLATGEPYDFEMRLRRHDGEFRWFQIRGQAHHDSQARIVRWYGLLTDVDDRKRAESLLAAEKSLLEMVASGRSLREILTAVTAVIESAAPDCRCEVQLTDGPRTGPIGAAPALQAAAEPEVVSRTPVMSTTGVLLANMCLYPRAHRTATVQDDLVGLAAHIAGIAIERHQSEDELRRREYMLATAERLTQMGSFAYYIGSQTIAFSDELRRIFEFEEDEDVTVESLRKRMHPDEIEQFREVFARARSGRGNPEYEARLVMADGRIKYVRTMSHMVVHEDGRVECIGANQDITRYRLAQDALDKVRSDLAHVTRVMSLGTLTASIAHEVNQPLAGITTNANTCVRMLSSQPPNVAGALETAKRTIRDATRASEVVKRLRSLFARNTTSSSDVDLNDAATEVVSLMSSDLNRNRVQVRTELSSDLPVIAADRVQLQQVILNLIRNAADAMANVDGQRLITLRTAHDDAGNVQLSVLDRGVGFAAGTAEQMFQPFYTTKDSGMGIGLSVSRTIIEGHSGRLWAEPAPGGTGAMFSFTIPVRRPVQ
jgi:PAS domain S-box-containing protein